MTNNSAIHKKYHGPLIALATSDKKTQRHLIRVLSNQVIRILAQIAANVVNGNIPLTKKQLRKLSYHKTVLRSLRDKKRAGARRRILLRQKGGFLPFLIPLAASAVGGLLGKALSE